MSEKNNNFKQLKQLLKLKRHEIPPPGYFNHFSGDVISRLRAGESGQPEGLIERIQSESSLLAFLLPLQLQVQLVQRQRHRLHQSL